MHVVVWYTHTHTHIYIYIYGHVASVCTHCLGFIMMYKRQHNYIKWYHALNLIRNLRNRVTWLFKTGSWYHGNAVSFTKLDLFRALLSFSWPKPEFQTFVFCEVWQSIRTRPFLEPNGSRLPRNVTFWGYPDSGTYTQQDTGTERKQFW